MDPRVEQRALLAAQIEEGKVRCRQEVAGWITLYPSIEVALTKWGEQQCADFDDMLVRFDANQPFASPATIEADKRRYWEKLVILGSVDPDMNIVQMHDEACAQIDQALAEGESRKQAIEAATSQSLAAMGNTAIDYYLANKEKQPRPGGDEEGS